MHAGFLKERGWWWDWVLVLVLVLVWFERSGSHGRARRCASRAWVGRRWMEGGHWCREGCGY